MSLADDPVSRIMLPAVLIFFTYTWIQFFRRKRALRLMVKRRGWQWLGEALPYYLPDTKLLFGQNRRGQQTAISNAFAGTIEGKEFIAFDCTFGSGRRRITRSCVCARASENPFSVGRFDSSYIVSEIEGWFAISTERPHALQWTVIEMLIDNIR